MPGRLKLKYWMYSKIKNCLLDTKCGTVFLINFTYSLFMCQDEDENETEVLVR